MCRNGTSYPFSVIEKDAIFDVFVDIERYIFFFADDGSTETGIESKTQSDGVSPLSINGCGSFEGVNVASFRIEITISPSQKLPNCDNGVRFFEFVFDEKIKE